MNRQNSCTVTPEGNLGVVMSTSCVDTGSPSVLANACSAHANLTSRAKPGALTLRRLSHCWLGKSTMRPALHIIRASSHRKDTLRHSTRISQRATYASHSTSGQPTVQTPVQSQNKDDIPHLLRPDAEGRVIQTPIQSQDPAGVVASQGQTTRPRVSNAGPVLTFWGLLFATPIVTYLYYEHRKEHMDQKRENLRIEAQEKYKQRNG